MNRITDAQLQKQVDLINKITGSPAEPYTDGQSNPGNFHLNYAYGGACLRRMSKGGGASSPLNTGCVSKKELYSLLSAFISGINEGASLTTPI